MSMRYYGVEGYGFYESETTVDRVKDFLVNDAPTKVKDAFEGKKFSNLEELTEICEQLYNVCSPSVILSESISEATRQDVQCVYDEDNGFGVFLIPHYPWDVYVAPIFRDTYESIAKEYALKFYTNPTIEFEYNTAVYWG